MRCVLIAAAVVLTSPLVLGQSVLTKKDGKELVHKSIDDMQLRSPGSSPFHLTARVHFAVNGKALDGTYELFWAAPDRYREEFRMGSIAETDVELEDKLYIVRTTPALPLPLWGARNLLFPPTGGPWDSPRVRSVDPALNGASNRVCVEADYNVSFREQFCFDATTHEIISIEAGDPHGTAPMRDVRRELSEFSRLETKRFPQHLFYDDAGEKLDIHVESLDAASKFADGVFVPPSNAAVRDWCPDPTQGDTAPWPYRPTMTLSKKSAAIPTYAVLIGRHGRVEKVFPEVSGGEEFDQTMEKFLRDVPFPIKSCGGKPIQYEEIVFPAIRVPPGFD